MMITLVRPHAGLLAEYAAALRTGWSPSNTRDLTGPHLAAIEADPDAFLADYDWAPGKTVPLEDGTLVPRLPGQQYWISDGAFCGTIGFRYQPGTTDLPLTTRGHIGYSIVPWKRRRGIATAALVAVLPIAHAAGLPHVVLTTDPDNIASQGVILAAGGVRVADQPSADGFFAYTIQTAR